jgi:zinc transporter, ZIP family
VIDYPQLLLLGALAGFTVFLGLPVAILRNISRRSKGFLNAISIGILLFLVADVLSNAWTTVKNEAASAYAGHSSVPAALLDLAVMIAGLGLGIFMLVAYERRYARNVVVAAAERQKVVVSTEEIVAVEDSNREKVILQRQQVAELLGNPYNLATMIAMSIGLHNFAEGLAIGQSYASGAVALAVLLVIGFAAHNATEGFGIAGPLAASNERPKPTFLVKMGLIAGGPTFLGTVIGSIAASTSTKVLFLSLAAGALIYVTLFMYSSGRRQTSNGLMMVGIFIGLLAGLLTDLIVSLSGL